jgi:hypothetical protein
MPASFAAFVLFSPETVTGRIEDHTRQRAAAIGFSLEVRQKK